MKKIIHRIKAIHEAQGALGQQLIKTAFGSMGMKVTSKGIGFLNAVLLAKILGPSGYGIYSYVLALVSLLTIPSQMGIPTLAVREVATTNALYDWGHMKGMIIRSHQAILLFTSLLVSAALILLYFFGQNIPPAKLHTMLLGLILLPVISLASLRSSMLKGLHKIILGLIPEQVIKPALLLAVLIVIFFIPGIAPHTPAVAMLFLIISACIALGVGVYFFHVLKPAQLTNAHAQYKTASWLKSSIPLGLTAGIVVINNHADTFLLGTFRTDAEVGMYRVAAQIATLVIFCLQIVNGILAPHIVRLYAKEEMERLQKLITKSARAVLALTLPVILVIIVLGQIGIKLAFGPDFVAAYIPLIILCAGQLVNASMCSVLVILNMTGHEREATKSMAISAVICIVLHMIFIPLWGMTGAALATAITTASWNIMLCRKVYTHTGIKASAFT